MAIQKNFVIKNGLEVDSNLIVADAQTNKVGIGTAVPQYTLHVNGGIGATSLNVTNTSTVNNLAVTGISTINNLVVNGTISIGNSTGTQNQYLVSTGTGVTWRTRGDIRKTTAFTATNGQTSFNVSYSIGYVDVFINGVKLTNTEFTATNGTTVILDDACFGNETVEFITYEIDYPLTFSGITIQDENSTVGTGISAITFIGAGVIATVVGSSATVYVSGEYASNAGIATYATTAGIATYATTAGIATYASNAGIATYASNAGISTVAENLTGSPNIEVGIITATGGFVSIAGTTPITIELIGNQLTFNAVGIGSSTLTLF